MVGYGDRSLKDIAGDVETPPNQLAELSRSSDAEIRLLVASNPNTPVDTLMKLGEEFPDAIVDNPVFDLLKIEDINSDFVRLSLARSTKTDPKLLTELVINEDENEAICFAVAGNPNTPIETLRRLIGWRHRDDDGDVPHIRVTREALNNPSMTVSDLEEELDLLIDSGWDELLWEFCRLPKLSLQMIEKLARKYGTARLLIDLPIVQQSPHILDIVARYSWDEDVIIKIINNPLTLDSTLNYLAVSTSYKVRNALVERPGIPQKALDIILFMQGKPGTPVDVLNELGENNRLDILQLLTKYSETPSEILDKVAELSRYETFLDTYKFARDNWDIYENLALHPNTSHKTLKLLTTSCHWNKRSAAWYENTRRIIEERISGKHILKRKPYASKMHATQDRYSRENLYEYPDPDSIPF